MEVILGCRGGGTVRQQPEKRKGSSNWRRGAFRSKPDTTQKKHLNEKLNGNIRAMIPELGTLHLQEGRTEGHPEKGSTISLSMYARPAPSKERERADQKRGRSAVDAVRSSDSAREKFEI